MTALINDPKLEEKLIAERQAAGADKFDEVWDGVYVMSPLANDEHQYLVKELTTVLTFAVDWAKLGQTRPGVNISDRKDDWTKNYRCPDVTVFLNETKAENCDAFWFGGPDFGIEIVSSGDRIVEKLSFYAAVGARELLVIDRDPWVLTLSRLAKGELLEVAKSTFDDDNILVSEIVPLSFQLCQHDGGFTLGNQHHDRKQEWFVQIDAR